VRVEATERRLAALREADAGLVFGRIDNENGESLYIGRVGIDDENHEPLVVDWRAPAAEPFYRATPGQPLGVVRRRHFLLRGRRLVGIEDDLLSVDPGDIGGDIGDIGDIGGDIGDIGGEAAGDGRAGPVGRQLVLVGEAALLASLSRARTGRMADIVATIQREQDEIIRASLPGILVVQGGPGTGKTAVALHRAAYLLYTHRFPLERAGVLLVGPNRIFLRYIERVLPALGEHTVTFSTPATLLPAIRAVGSERGLAAQVKGDVRMAAVLARAVRQRQRPLPRAATIPFGNHLLTLTPEASRRIVNRVKRRRGTHNERRVVFERQLAAHLIEQWREREGDSGPASGNGNGPGEAPLPEGGERRLRRSRPFVEAAERMWPVLTPEALLNDLLGTPALLRLAAGSMLTTEEVAVLERPRQRRSADVTWSEEDVALLDEAAGHLGPVPTGARPAPTDHDSERFIFERALEDVGDVDPLMRADLLDHLARWTAEPAGDDEPDAATRTFGHVLVDEAQDLSPMQARMIGRRCPGGSMTVVGDLGQASRDHSAQTWHDVVAHLPRRRPVRHAELTVNYRTPVEVMDVASRVLAVADPGLTPPRSVRAAGEQPVFTEAGTAPRLPAAAADVARSELARVAGGRVAVIAPEELAETLRTALDLDDAGAAVLEQPIGVYPVNGAKGLEFDAVVVVEPGAIVAERPQGLRALYVSLTRTTRRLHVVSARPLPAPLAAAASAGEAVRS
jgi:DNA helicase IV